MNIADWYLPSIPVSQLSDYQVSLSSPTGLSALNMRPMDLIVTNTNTNTNSPMEADIPTEPLYEDISESDDRTEADMIIDTMNDAQQFINNVLNSVDRLGPVQQVVGPVDALQLIQRIEPLQAIEPPNQFADPPIQHAEQPIIESPVQRIQRINSDDPLDDNVPGKYFDC